MSKNNIGKYYSNESGLQTVAGTLPACCDVLKKFNGSCYLERYPDVAADGKYNTPEKALNHWLSFGQYEGRIPGCDAPAGCDCTDIGSGGGGSDVPIDPGGGGTAGTGIMDWINKNPLIVAGAAGLIIWALSRKKKRRKVY